MANNDKKKNKNKKKNNNSNSNNSNNSNNTNSNNNKHGNNHRHDSQTQSQAGVKPGVGRVELSTTYGRSSRRGGGKGGFKLD